jgi:hypothetical protein
LHQRRYRSPAALLDAIDEALDRGIQEEVELLTRMYVH